MGESTTNGAAGQMESGRWCECCDESIEGEARHHDGELLCPPCWAEREAEEVRGEIEEYEVEAESARAELEARVADFDTARAELEREYDEDMAGLRHVHRTWARRLDKARERLSDLMATAGVVGESRAPAPALPPIAGGQDGGPSEADWADYREHFDRVDGMTEPDWPADGNPVMWGYE